MPDGNQVKGKVDYLVVGQDWGHVSVAGSYFILWGPGEARPFASFEWFSLLREALANDLDISIGYTDPPVIISTISLHGR